jgi:hypothetical protein
MNKMRSNLILLILFICIASCKKDTPKFNDVESPDITKYVINNSGNKINSYSKYLNGILQQTVLFIDQDTAITVVTKNSSDEIINKEIYFIGDNGFAESSIDSGFNNSILTYFNTKSYQYFNNFLVKTTLYYKNFGPSADSGIVTISTSISDENISSSKVSYPNYSTGCTDYFDYNSSSNSIDVRYFSNGITGKTSKNLIAHTSWDNGCPDGPSMTVSCSDYNYEFNSNNYISIMKETYTPSYHMGDTKEVTRTIKTTIYEY